MKIDLINKNEDTVKSFWERGYDWPIEEAAKTLNCSERYFKDYFRDKLHIVTYPVKFAYDKGNAQTYINKEEFITYLMNNGSWQCQTETIDLYSYIAHDKKKANAAYDMYRQIMDRRHYTPGTVPLEVLEFINDNYITNLKIKNYSKRSDIPWVDIRGRDITKLELFEKETWDEEYYREIFKKGYIRLKLGYKKALYFKTKQVDMKMPYLIPYGMKIIVK